MILQISGIGDRVTGQTQLRQSNYYTPLTHIKSLFSAQPTTVQLDMVQNVGSSAPGGAPQPTLGGKPIPKVGDRVLCKWGDWQYFDSTILRWEGETFVRAGKGFFRDQNEEKDKEG